MSPNRCARALCVRPTSRPLPRRPWSGAARGLALAALFLASLFRAAPTFADDPATPPAPATPAAPTSQAQPSGAPKAPSREELEAAFASRPGDVRSGLALQDAWLATSEHEVVLRWFKKHADARPGDRVAEFLLGRLTSGEPGREAMWTALLARLGRPPEDDAGLAEAWECLALAEDAAGRSDRAAQAYERRLSLGAQPWLWMRLGSARERCGEWALAEQAYRSARAADEAAVGPANALALVLARQGKHAEAQRLARATTTLAPTSGPAFLHLGLVLSLGKRKDQAVDAYTKALELAGRDAATLAALGASLAEVEQYALAERALEAALALEPANSTALLQAAGLAVQREQWAQARKLLALAARAAPKSGQVAFLQGVAAERSGQGDQAVLLYRKALFLEPNVALYALALAALLMERGSFETAQEVLERALVAAPGDPGLHMRLGFCAMQRKKWSTASESFLRAAALAPKDPDPYLYLAVIAGDHLRDMSNALLHLTEYRKRGGREPSALAWLKQLEAAQK